MTDLRSETEFTESELRNALVNNVVGVDDDYRCDTANNLRLGEQLDWVLTDAHEETTRVQTLKEELRRLQVLKSYRLVNVESEDAVDKITAMTARIFNAPMSCVAIIDLGRLLCFSTYGFDRSFQVPRKQAICSHTILSKTNAMVLRDASKDSRFVDAPIVQFGVRFYAGVTLQSPEGCNLGTFCIMDTKPRPEGLTPEEQTTLSDLADITVKALVHRRQRLITQESTSQFIANTSHDLMTPLSGMQLALSLLLDDQEHRLDVHQRDLVTTASSCSDMMVQICKTSIDLLRGLTSTDAVEVSETPSSSASVGELFKSLEMVTATVPKGVPLVIKVHPAVLSIIPRDAVTLFRSALRLLTCAIEKTNQGYVQLNIFTKLETKELLFECVDTADNHHPTDNDQRQNCFQTTFAKDGNLKMNHSLVASLVKSMGGQYGSDKNTTSNSGSVFWFSVPISPDKENVGTENLHFESAANTKISLDGSRQTDSPALISVDATCNDEIASDQHRLSTTKDSSPLPSQVETTTTSSLYSSNTEDTDSSQSSDTSASQPHLVTPTGLDTSSSSSSTSVPSAAQNSPGGGVCRQRLALVIDDSLVVRKSLAFALKKLGFEVSQAMDGLQGLKCLQEKLFDVAFCDFLMPVMDGLDCVKQFRAWEKANRPAAVHQLIIGISAHACAKIAAQGREAGMDDFRSKPIGIKQLMAIKESDAVKTMSCCIAEASGCTKQPVIVEVDDRICNEEKKRENPYLTASYPLEVALTGVKRQRRVENDFCSTNRKSSACLVVWSDSVSTAALEALQDNLVAHGWIVSSVRNEKEARRLLQQRNWDTVLVQDLAKSCITGFRDWEDANRVNRQKNVFLVSSSSIPSSGEPNCVVQAPCGFDYVLGSPATCYKIQQALARDKTSTSLAPIVKRMIPVQVR